MIRLTSPGCSYYLLMKDLMQVDYTTAFVFRILMFVDNGVAAGMGM